MIAIKMHKRREKVGMSVVAEILLDIVNNAESVSVMNLIAHAIAIGAGSQATNHRSMLWLKTNKYIKVTFKDGDNRTKYLVSTKKGLSHFKGLE
jgi:H+/gluconate symporter-like permease